MWTICCIFIIVKNKKGKDQTQREELAEEIKQQNIENFSHLREAFPGRTTTTR